MKLANRTQVILSTIISYIPIVLLIVIFRARYVDRAGFDWEYASIWIGNLLFYIFYIFLLIISVLLLTINILLILLLRKKETKVLIFLFFFTVSIFALISGILFFRVNQIFIGFLFFTILILMIINLIKSVNLEILHRTNMELIERTE